MDYATEKAKFDEEVTHDDVKVFIDSKAQLSLLGTEMDFVETSLASEFVFLNPNIEGTCGCGESFNLKPDNSQNSQTGASQNNNIQNQSTSFQSANEEKLNMNTGWNLIKSMTCFAYTV